MAYRPGNTNSPVRDVTYPSEIAGQRPMMSPRICCDNPMDEREDCERGGITDDRSAEFKRQLRSGIGMGRPDSE